MAKMQILNRAKGKSEGEVIAFNENPENVKEEAIRRGMKAGICSSGGEPNERTKIMALPPTKKYRENYIRIFGHE